MGITRPRGSEFQALNSGRPHLKPKETTTKALKVGDRWSRPSAESKAFGITKVRLKRLKGSKSQVLVQDLSNSFLMETTIGGNSDSRILRVPNMIIQRYLFQ